MLSRALFVTAVFLGALTQAVNIQQVDASLTPDVYAQTEVSAEKPTAEDKAIAVAINAADTNTMIQHEDVEKSRIALKPHFASHQLYKEEMKKFPDLNYKQAAIKVHAKGSV